VFVSAIKGENPSHFIHNEQSRDLSRTENQAMKRALGFRNMKRKEEKKKEATTSRLRKNKQTKIIVKQEVVSSESDSADSDYAEFLRTYDPEKESSDSENYIILLDSPSGAGTQSPETVESQKEDSESKSDVESK
jgi:hypothetical protein